MAWMRHVEVTVGPKGGEGFKIDGLKIEFNIEKTDSPEPNKSAIKIYNLSEDTSNKVIVSGNHISLKAGYRDETIGTIFLGDVLKGRRYKDGNEYITELEVFDGRTEVMSSYVSVSYAKGVSASTIVQDYLNIIGLPFKGQEHIPAGEVYPHGYCYIGMASDGLRDVLNRFSLMYTIQNKMLYIMKPGEAADTVGLKITPATGLLSTPQPVSDKTEDDAVETDASNRWSFETMLFPELLPGAAFKVESSTLNAEVMVKKAVYSGDNWDGDYKIALEAEAL